MPPAPGDVLETSSVPLTVITSNTAITIGYGPTALSVPAIDAVCAGITQASTPASWVRRHSVAIVGSIVNVAPGAMSNAFVGTALFVTQNETRPLPMQTWLESGPDASGASTGASSPRTC